MRLWNALSELLGPSNSSPPPWASDFTEGLEASESGELGMGPGWVSGGGWALGQSEIGEGLSGCAPALA